MASSVTPSTNTLRRARRVCCAVVSRSLLQSSVARSVRWRSGKSWPADIGTARPRSKRSNICRGSRICVRAAANSMASGSPSSRRTRSTTASALPRSTTKAGRTRRARSTNSSTAGERRAASTAPPRVPRSVEAAGSRSGSTVRSRSPRKRSGRRLVTRALTPGQASSSVAKPGPASRTCSKLSISSSICCPRSHSTVTSSGAWAPSTVTPSRSASTRETSDGSCTVSNGTNATPSGNAAIGRRQASSANRLLPTPPGPVSVRIRHPSASNRCTSASSASLPTVGVIGIGGAVTGRRAIPGSGVSTASKRSVSSTIRSSLTTCSSSSASAKWR